MQLWDEMHRCVGIIVFKKRVADAVGLSYVNDMGRDYGCSW